MSRRVYDDTLELIEQMYGKHKGKDFYEKMIENSKKDLERGYKNYVMRLPKIMKRFNIQDVEELRGILLNWKMPEIKMEYDYQKRHGVPSQKFKDDFEKYTGRPLLEEKPEEKATEVVTEEVAEEVAEKVVEKIKEAEETALTKNGERVAREELTLTEKGLKRFDPSEYIPKETDVDIKNYVDRKDYMEKLRIFHENQASVMLIGGAGAGKTSMAKKYAFDNKLPFLSISADVQLSVRELFGSVQIQGATSFFVEGLFVKFTQIPSVILIDEITAIDPAKNFMFHQIISSREFFSKDSDGGRGKTYKVHDKCFIMFAGNPPVSKFIATTRLNAAFLDRLGVIVVEPLSEDDLKKALKDMKLKSEDLEHLIKLFMDVRGLIEKENYRTEMSLRTLRRIAMLRSSGLDWKESLMIGFLNSVASFTDEKTLSNIKTLLTQYW